MSDYGNQPFPIVRAQIQRKRRRRFGRAVGAFAVGSILGSRKGRRALYGVSPKMGLMAAFGARKAKLGLRVAKKFGSAQVNKGFMGALKRWPSQTLKVGGYARRGSKWLSGIKTALKAF